MSQCFSGRPAPQHMAGSPWSILDGARYLNISERHLTRLIDEGKVASFKLGRRRFITDAEIRRVAEGGVE